MNSKSVVVAFLAKYLKSFKDSWINQVLEPSVLLFEKKVQVHLTLFLWPLRESVVCLVLLEPLELRDPWEPVDLLVPPALTVAR